MGGREGSTGRRVLGPADGATNVGTAGTLGRAGTLGNVGSRGTVGVGAMVVTAGAVGEDVIWTDGGGAGVVAEERVVTGLVVATDV
jgi:hypothetical protein